MLTKTFRSRHKTHSWYEGTGGTTIEVVGVGDFGVGGISDFTDSTIDDSRGDGSGFGRISGFGSSVFGAGAAAVTGVGRLRRGSRDMLTTAGVDPASSVVTVSSPGAACVVTEDLRSSSYSGSGIFPVQIWQLTSKKCRPCCGVVLIMIDDR